MRFFWDIQNNPGRGKAKDYRDLDYSEYHKDRFNNCFIIHWTKEKVSHVFASSLTGSNTKRANLTWLPVTLSVLDMIIACIICSYDVTGADFENLLYAFGQSEKR